MAASLCAFAAISAGAQTAKAVHAETRAPSIALLPRAEMTDTDPQLLELEQEAVARSARIYGYTLDSTYSYRQIACPLAPHSLLLSYESDAPNGAISRFTAVVSREETPSGDSGNPVQILPILHFGVMPFVSASSSPHSIEVFNKTISNAPDGTEALAEMRSGGAPFLTRGLCYLAMVGAEPEALRSPSLDAATIRAPGPTLQFLEKGRARQLISIRNSATTYQLWSLTFSARGRLLTATEEEDPVDATRRLIHAPRLDASTVPPSPPPPPTPPARELSTMPPATIRAGQPAVAAPLPTSEHQPTLAATPSTWPAAVEAAAPRPVDAAAAPQLAAPQLAAPQAPAPTAATAQNMGLKELPEPPHRLLPDPPLPPSRIIPASSLKAPPHLPQ